MVEAIGFDLFNTLITVHPAAMKDAHDRMILALADQGLHVERGSFLGAYVEAAKRFLLEAHKEGKETHNRFWIAAALAREGHPVAPSDPRIAVAVDAYFTAFYPHCRLIPGTRELLEELQGRFRLGLLTNFTDAPAGQRIIEETGLGPFFAAILISGRLGYRKPHPYVFARLVQELGMPPNRILFIGDDLEADFQGAKAAGLNAVLTTYVRDSEVPTVHNPLSEPPQQCPGDVPTISSWDDLRKVLYAS